MTTTLCPNCHRPSDGGLCPPCQEARDEALACPGIGTDLSYREDIKATLAQRWNARAKLGDLMAEARKLRPEDLDQFVILLLEEQANRRKP